MLIIIKIRDGPNLHRKTYSTPTPKVFQHTICNNSGFTVDVETVGETSVECVCHYDPRHNSVGDRV